MTIIARAATVSLLVLTYFIVSPVAQASKGILVVDVKPYESDVEMNKNVKKQVEHGGLDWGLVDRNVVFTMVNKKFVRAELPYLTRYGEAKQLEVEPGTYTITCIGFVLASTSKDVEKVLSASAFFNENIVTFAVLPEQKTTLEVLPIFQKQTKRGFWQSFQTFSPDLQVRVVEQGIDKSVATVNQKTSSSIPWDVYSGPLKFSRPASAR